MIRLTDRPRATDENGSPPRGNRRGVGQSHGIPCKNVQKHDILVFPLVFMRNRPL